MGLFYAELKRRKVVWALAAYAAVSWVILQVVDVVAAPLELPIWIPRAFIISVLFGLPIVVVLSWFFDISRMGLIRTSPIGERDRKSIGPGSLSLLTVGVLAAAALISYQWEMGQEGADNGLPAISLAIFPFDPLPVDVEPHLARLSDELIDRLGADRRLRIASNDAVEALQTDNLASQATQLGVRYILSVTIESADNAVDLAVSLFDREADQEVWQKLFQNAQLPSANPLIIDQLLNFLGLAQPSAKQLTTNAKAYDLYLQGLRFWSADATDVTSEELFQAAIQEDSRFSLPHAAMCRLYLNRYHYKKAPVDFESAEKFCFRALTLDDQSLDVHLSVASLYAASGQIDKARDSYNKALSISPEVFRARLELASSYISDDPALAERLLIELIQDHPGSPSGYAKLQSFYYKQGRYEEAVEPARWWVRLDPSHEGAKYSLYAALMYAGMFTDAQSLLLSMLETDSGSKAGIPNNLAVTYFYEGEYAKAAEFFRIAVDREPENTFNYRNLGDAVWHLEGKAQARTYFEETVRLGQLELEINPEDAEVLSNMVVAWGSLGDQQKLEEYLRRSLSVAGDDPLTTYDVAIAYSRLGKLNLARDFATEAREQGFPKAILKADPDIRLAGFEFERDDDSQTVQ